MSDELDFIIHFGIVLFFIELLGTLLVLFTITNPIPISTLSGINSNLNTAILNIQTSFSTQTLSPLNTQNGGLFNGFIVIINWALILVNLIISVLLLLIAILTFIFIVILLIGTILLVFLPSLLSEMNIGAFGLFFSLGYWILLMILGILTFNIVYGIIRGKK